ncbi:M14 family zinc carboxypeptidase [Aquimarina hainanensis]|uniref:M14 family zinc carboxypeptidase n=2 Tax=Aquimarina hainanensis TaxID=1578017 RepID=A0ABW5NC17_9FLAO|nr:M14 family zinc carboxypeptidase [Aquimarina sp. TRL1]QKX06447.1 peptidase M14 [Aquimarina sp. TRL1]
MNIERLKTAFANYKESSLFGRYIHLEHIEPLLKSLSDTIEVTVIGRSENNAPIYMTRLGNGKKKLLYWSQMHGNESTTTKAVFDFINTLIAADNEISSTVLENCSLYIIPILNPDGAKAYTRLNYNSVDLNRDAQDLTQKESVVLKKVIDELQPDFAFNLHGQRTIFSAGETNASAIVSFLSAAGDQERSISPSRKIAMEVIAEMNTILQQCIPDSVGRYDDGFNINCTGDTMEFRGIPTVLFEAGHYPTDYDREKTRALIYYSLISSALYLASNTVTGDQFEAYFTIPENEKCFYDIIIREVLLEGEIVDIGVQYEEKLIENEVKFIPKVAEIGNLEKKFGHREIFGKKRAIRYYNDVVEIVREVVLPKITLDFEIFSLELSKS